MRAALLLLFCLGLAACAAPGPFPVDKGFGGPAPYGDGRHPGIDYGVRAGTPVIAVADGRVIFVATAADGAENGLEVLVWHPRFRSLYAHLSTAFVEKRERVRRGQLIGLSGESNNYGRPHYQHLHFGLCRPGPGCRLLSEAFDPAGFWLGGTPQCFDPARDYAGAGDATTLPLACGAHAGELLGQAQGRTGISPASPGR